MKMNLSFKENERDMRLYAEVMGAGDKSNFIKDCIQFWIDNKKSVANTTQGNTNVY